MSPQTTLPASTTIASAVHQRQTPLRYAFIHAQWHADIVQQARVGFLDEMRRHDVPASAVDVIEVPGAFELPLLAKKLCLAGRHAAVAACALVVDGGIYRHEFVAAAVVDALMAVQLETGVPVLSVVLTPHHFHAGEEHQEFFAAHFVRKGAEAARASVATAELMQRLEREQLLPSSAPDVPTAGQVARG